MREATVEDLMDRYRVLLLDAYGVLVHSSGAIDGARELIEALNRSGKPYYVLTNDASKLPATAAARYRGFGLAIEPERIITSGGLITGYFHAHGLSCAPAVVLGPADSALYVELAGGRVAPPGEPFDALVICDEEGFPFVETVDAALSALFRKLDRGEAVHLVLPNPDLIYPRADGGFGMTAGSVALVFEAALHLRYPDRPDLRFVRLGKPHAAMFQEALSRSGTMDMVMIGDQFETDIRGASEFGLASALVAGGVTSRGFEKEGPGHRPTYLLRSIGPSRP